MNPSDLANFCNITSVSEEEARYYLEAFSGDYDEAVKAYFENEDNAQPEMKINQVNIQNFQNQSNTTKINTLQSLQTKSDSESEDGQTFYVGGSETGGGGQQVLGPPRKNKNKQPLSSEAGQSSDTFIHDLFETLRDTGAEVLDVSRVSDANNKTAKKTVPFSGTGYKTGDDSLSSQCRIATNSSTDNSSSPSNPEKNVVVKMWRDGFSLDDGPLRPYSSPESVAFFNDVRSGKIPQELARSACGNLVSVLLEDHHHEDWSISAESKFKPFSGKGKMLGFPTPTFMENSTTSTTNPSSSSTTPPAEKVHVDETKPVTRIQVRFENGERLILNFNHSHTLGDVRRSIISSRPELATGSAAFSLFTSYPSRELTQEEQDGRTLAEANLLNSMLLLRLPGSKQ